MMGKKSFVFRFDDVEVREREFSLLKGGKEVTVEPKAFRTLLLLLRNPQKLITKDELLNAVWGDTAVTEGSVTRCIWLLRRLLGDDINEPRYIATVATVGYRFVCAVEAAEDPVGAVDAPIQASEINAGKDKATHPRIPLAVAATAVIVACGALLLGWWRTPTAVPVVESVTQLTDDPLRKSNLVTDGSRIYFNEGMEGSSRIAQVSIEGGPSVPLQTTLPDPIPTAAAREGTALLSINMIPVGFSNSLWSIPLPAGEPRGLGNVRVQSADMFPDNRILYSVGKDVLIAENDGSSPRKLASLAGIVQNTVISPDGTRVLLQVNAKGDLGLNHDTFEMLADGTGVREIRKANANECCFGWSWDGKYLLYSARTGKRWDLWALPVRAGIFRRSETPIRLTNGPISFSHGGRPSRDGKQIFAIGSKERGQLVRYDMKSQHFVPLLAGISATDATYSTDGNWVAYTMFPEHTLWRSRSDGSERMQLTYPPMEVWEPFISPDGTKIAYNSVGDNSVCVIDMNGGSPRTLSASAFSPKWSPDGNSVAYNRLKADGSDNG